jgi:hypothetical protein
VDLQNIYKKLIGEIRNHPKKAVLTGMLLLVGLYFWVPMFFRSENKLNLEHNSQLNNGLAVNTLSNLEKDGITKNKTTTKLRSWKEILKLINNDPRTRPAESMAFNRDPFKGPQEIITQKTQEELEREKLPPPSPSSLGIALTSTIIGPQGAIARIAGKTYRRGQTIETQKEGRNFKFLISEIADRRVVLEAEGKRFELYIPDPGKSGRIILGDFNQ